MMDEQDISERNQKLINFISGLKLGIHVIDLPEKPKFISADYKWWMNGYVKNFHIILTNKEWDAKEILKCRVDDNPTDFREKFAEWMIMYEHKRIYTLVSEDYPELFVCGYNHHDKINKQHPYPVFARFFPQIYYDHQKAQDVADKFLEYNLIVK